MHNLFESIPTDISDEIFSELARGENIRIERIISKGYCSPKSEWYCQEENEWVVVLKGEAIMVFEDGEDTHLMAGSYVNIPVHKKHKVSWTKPNTETIWLAIHYK